MAIAIAEIASNGAGLRDEAALDYVVDRWHWWARNAKDVGVQTAVLGFFLQRLTGGLHARADCCRRIDWRHGRSVTTREGTEAMTANCELLTFAGSRPGQAAREVPGRTRQSPGLDKPHETGRLGRPPLQLAPHAVGQKSPNPRCHSGIHVNLEILQVSPRRVWRASPLVRRLFKTWKSVGAYRLHPRSDAAKRIGLLLNPLVGRLILGNSAR